MQVAIQRESGGIKGLVGHDEDAASSGIKSRRDFIASGKKSSGASFTPSDSLVTTRNFLNDDHGKGGVYSAINPNANDLGLDWRFSHGVGMFGVTFFPKGSSYGDYTKGLDMKNPSRHIVVKDLLNPEIDMVVATEQMTNNFKKCSGNIENTFRSYGSGSCSGNSKFIAVEAPLRKNLYDQCVAQDK
jgi:hypothetical protein